MWFKCIYSKILTFCVICFLSSSNVAAQQIFPSHCSYDDAINILNEKYSYLKLTSNCKKYGILTACTTAQIHNGIAYKITWCPYYYRFNNNDCSHVSFLIDGDETTYSTLLSSLDASDFLNDEEIKKLLLFEETLKEDKEKLYEEEDLKVHAFRYRDDIIFMYDSEHYIIRGKEQYYYNSNSINSYSNITPVFKDSTETHIYTTTYDFFEYLKERGDKGSNIRKEIAKKADAAYYSELLQKQEQEQEQLRIEAEIQKQKRLEQLTKKYGLSVAKEIISRYVHLGWDKEKCIEAWGHPNDVHKTINSLGVHELWDYGDGCFLYFDSNKLTSMQN